MELPETIGDRLGAELLGRRARPDGDRRLDHRLLLQARQRRARRAARSATEIVTDRDNFPTDRYVLEGLAANAASRSGGSRPTPHTGPDTRRHRSALISDKTALVTFSQVNYRSAFILDTTADHRDRPRRTARLTLWDLCHSAGAIPVTLDDDRRRPRRRLHLQVPQRRARGARVPVRARATTRRNSDSRSGAGSGAREPFEMAQGYVPARGHLDDAVGDPAGPRPDRRRSAGIELVDRGGHRRDPRQVSRAHRVCDRADRRAARAARVQRGLAARPASSGGHTSRSSTPKRARSPNG